MNGAEWGGIAAIAAGAPFTALALWVWLRGRRRSARAEGEVVQLESRGSGEFPVVTFTPAGPPNVPAAPVTFHSAASLGHHHVGQRLAVSYEPGNPSRASIMTSRASTVLALAIGGSGLTCVGTGLLLLLAYGPMHEARDAAVKKLVAAARSGDASRLAEAAPRAKIDAAFLLTEGPRSRSHRIGSEVMGFSDSCAEVILEPHRARFVAYLDHDDGRWRVVRAGPNDPACEGRMSD